MLNSGKIMKSIKFSIRAIVISYLIVITNNAVAEPSYKINPGDILRIDVWNEEGLTREMVVSPDGYISFPLISEIEIGGLTTSAAQQHMADALGKYLKDQPTVTVTVKQLLGNKISILGKVLRPGEYSISRPTDVMQALALAGGLNPYAAENKVKILRRNLDGEQYALEFRYGDVSKGKNLETNILMQSGDILLVP